MIPLFKVKMSENASSAVSEVLNSGFIGQGPKVEEFEDLLWAELKCKNRPVTVNSCTSAIDLALHLCGVGPGDEAICTPLTCWASNIGPVHRGATIRWADIDPITGLIDPDSVKSLITSKTKAIIAVNWAGRICDYKTLKSFGIPVIEDAAHTWDVLNESFGERGDYVCYSFQAIKFLTTGDGGILICEDKQKEEEARILRWYGLDRTKGETFRCQNMIENAGFKYHMNDIAATIGISNISTARDSVYFHLKNSRLFINNIHNKNIILPPWDNTCSFWLFSLHVLNNRKQEFIKYMEEKGISVSPVHYRNDLYPCTLKFKEKELPGVDRFSETQVAIPNGWWLTDDNIDYIIDTVNGF